MLRIPVPPLALLTTVCLAGCATTTARTSGGAPGYSLELVSVTPRPGTPLSAGQPVTVTIVARYRLEVAEKGKVVAVLQKADNSPLIPNRPQAFVEVLKGTGETTLTDTFEVPREIPLLRLLVFLAPEGLSQVSRQRLIEYPVE
jgi:hypothetical protein